MFNLFSVTMSDNDRKIKVVINAKDIVEAEERAKQAVVTYAKIEVIDYIGSFDAVEIR